MQLLRRFPRRRSHSEAFPRALGGGEPQTGLAGHTSAAPVDASAASHAFLAGTLVRAALWRPSKQRRARENGQFCGRITC